DNQPCQVILEMVKLASILKKIPKGVRVSAHQGSGSYNWQLHEVLALSPRGWDRAEEYHTDIRNGKIQQPSYDYIVFMSRAHRVEVLIPKGFSSGSDTQPRRFMEDTAMGF